ncbi:MAG: hypothetical protein FJ096_13165 [Deltaproteobacteria bacterium]|nr:hypothetical protein [Deltaproteobacteria bacterium]
MPSFRATLLLGIVAATLAACGLGATGEGPLLDRDLLATRAGPPASASMGTAQGASPTLPSVPVPLGEGMCAPHSECEAGAPLEATCSACTAALCQDDGHPECCNPTWSWDARCVWAARTSPACGHCRPRAKELDDTLADPLPGARGDQDVAEVAAGPAGQFLAVWQDQRDGMTAIVGTRFAVDADGGIQLADKGGLLIASGATGPQLHPHVRFDGERYVVAWTTGSLIKITWVEPDPTATPSVSDPFSTVPGLNIDIADLASTTVDGESVTVLLPYVRASAESPLPLPEFSGLRVTRTPGAAPSLDTVKLPTVTDGTQVLPTVTFCGKSFGIALGSQGNLGWNVVLRRLAQDMIQVKPWPVTVKSLAGSGLLTALALACTEARPQLYAAASMNLSKCLADATRIVRYDLEGPAVEAQPVTIDELPGRIHLLDAAPLLDGEASVWEQQTCEPKAWTGRTNLKGVTMAPLALPHVSPSIATSDKRVVTVATSRQTESTPLGREIVATATSYDEANWITLSTEPNQQGQLALAASGNGLVAAWTDFARGPRAGVIQLRRLEAEGGAPLGPTTLLSDDDVADSREPTIAAADEAWAAAWTARPTPNPGERTRLELALGGPTDKLTKLRLGEDNKLFAEPALTPVAGGFGLAFVAGSNVCTLGVCTFLPTFFGLGVVKSSADTANVEYRLLEALAPQTPRIATIAKGRVLLVWESSGNILGTSRDLGSLATIEDLDALPLVSDEGRQSQPSVVLRDENHGLLVWRDEVFEGQRVRARRLVRNPGLDLFLPEGPTLLVSGALAADRPRVALASDHAYVVVMEGSASGEPAQIFATLVSFEGERLDPEPVRLSSLEPEAPSPDATTILLGNSLAVWPTAVRAPGGALVVGYEQLLPTLGVPRVVTLTPLDRSPQGTVCGADAECVTGHCVDGVCCKSACDGACQTCALGPTREAEPDGVCRPVTSADDTVPPGADPALACSGLQTCDAKGKCRGATGTDCLSNSHCASGHCVEGPSGGGEVGAPGDPVGTMNNVCCDTACDGPCDTCAVTPGTCIQRACGAYSCALTGDKACLAACENTSECAAGFQCVAGACVTPPSNTPTVVACQVTVPGARPAGALPLVTVLAALARLGLSRRGGARRRVRRSAC